MRRRRQGRDAAVYVVCPLRAEFQANGCGPVEVVPSSMRTAVAYVRHGHWAVAVPTY